MKRIKLYAYFCNNLGDDLMVNILLEKFSTYNFYSNQFIPINNNILHNKNFTCKELLYQRYGRLNHLFNIITFKKIGSTFFDKIFQKYENSCECAVYIGGSLFMQDPLENAKIRIEHELQRINALQMHIIGANFGPYFTKDFLDGFEECFKNCKSVTFRDKYSFNLFSKYTNVSYAPDVVFNLDISPYANLPETNNVIISVIDFEKRNDLKEYNLSYEKHIKDCCIELLAKGYTPVLMSFCKAEGDEIAINRIYNQLPKNSRHLIKRYFYDGDINEALKYIASAKYIIATRFHAMILAIKFSKPFYCIAYNQKIENVLNDLNCDAYILPALLEETKANELIDKYSKPAKASEYIAEATKQFFLFEQFLKERGENER